MKFIKITELRSVVNRVIAGQPHSQNNGYGGISSAAHIAKIITKEFNSVCGEQRVRSKHDSSSGANLVKFN